MLVLPGNVWSERNYPVLRSTHQGLCQKLNRNNIKDNKNGKWGTGKIKDLGRAEGKYTTLPSNLFWSTILSIFCMGFVWNWHQNCVQKFWRSATGMSISCSLTILVLLTAAGWSFCNYNNNERTCFVCLFLTAACCRYCYSSGSSNSKLQWGRELPRSEQ